MAKCNCEEWAALGSYFCPVHGHENKFRKDGGHIKIVRHNTLKELLVSMWGDQWDELVCGTFGGVTPSGKEVEGKIKEHSLKMPESLKQLAQKVADRYYDNPEEPVDDWAERLAKVFAMMND